MSGDLHADLVGSDLHSPKAHESSHQEGGDDELDVKGLSGKLADKQDPLFTHADLVPDALPGNLMQLLYELPGIIATLEAKIELIAADGDIDITFPV